MDSMFRGIEAVTGETVGSSGSGLHGGGSE